MAQGDRPKVLATRQFPEDVEERLARDYDALLNLDDKIYSHDEVVRLANGCDAVVCAAGNNFDAALIEALPESVKILATFSVGYDHIDVAAAQRRGLIVTNTPDVLTDATADITLLCLLGAARRVRDGQQMLYVDGWKGWAPRQLMGTEVTGKRLAIFGMGRIGRAVAKRARGFEMEIHYSNRNRLPPELEEDATFHADPEDLLPIADFLSLNCPSTPETENFLNRERIARLPRGAIVVNSSRGNVIDEPALIEALRSGHLAAAGLDVFVGEPAVNPEFLTLDNVFLLPHMGSATRETRNAMGFRCLDNLDAFFDGRPLPSPVT